MGNVMTREAFLSEVTTSELLKEVDRRRDKEVGISLSDIRFQVNRLKGFGFKIIEGFNDSEFVDVKQVGNDIVFEFIN